MESERYRRGLEILKELDSKVTEQLAKLSEIAPEFAKYVVEFPFGDLCAYTSVLSTW
jgi:4-carboxymuconolactone decarboxylase